MVRNIEDLVIRISPPVDPCQITTQFIPVKGEADYKGYFVPKIVIRPGDGKTLYFLKIDNMQKVYLRKNTLNYQLQELSKAIRVITERLEKPTICDPEEFEDDEPEAGDQLISSTPMPAPVTQPIAIPANA
jgi:hypothetical protein